MYKKWGTLLFYLILIFLIITPLLTLARGKPTLAASIRTWSMAPQLTRGDMAFLLPVEERTELSQGEIVVFRAPEDGIRDWTMHRIVGGDAENGYITKGDANDRTDQEGKGYPPIKPKWIGGVVPTVGDVPLKIPLVGYLPLLLEQNLQDPNPMLIPAFIGILAVALVLDEVFKPKKKRRKEAIQKHHLYFIGGAAFALLMGAAMLMGSLFINFPYQVSDTPGALMGSDVGVLKKGDERQLTLAELDNHGGIPSLYFAASADPQVELERESIYLSSGEEAEINATVYAEENGEYQSSIVVGMFLPFLPSEVISFLAGVNIWLAFGVVSLLPALPLFAAPYLEPRFRRRFIRGWRRKVEKISGAVQ